MYQDIGMLLKQIHDSMEKSVNHDLKEHGLTFGQIRYLDYIYEQGGEVSLKNIEHYFRVAQPTVVGIVRRLVDKGFIVLQKDVGDNRVKHAVLTPQGTKICQNSEFFQQKAEHMLTKNLSAGEQEELARLLSVVLQGME